MESKTHSRRKSTMDCDKNLWFVSYQLYLKVGANIKEYKCKTNS